MSMPWRHKQSMPWRDVVKLHFLMSAQGTLFGKELEQCKLHD